VVQAEAFDDDRRRAGVGFVHQSTAHTIGGVISAGEALSH
jgi:hypothetical protein